MITVSAQLPPKDLPDCEKVSTCISPHHISPTIVLAYEDVIRHDPLLTDSLALACMRSTQLAWGLLIRAVSSHCVSSLHFRLLYSELSLRRFLHSHPGCVYVIRNMHIRKQNISGRWIERRMYES